MTAFVILATVLATAVLSGVIGMAGGVLLMAVLVTLLPVASAMILHGAVQAASNGARFLFLREHVMWGILPFYAIGALLAVLLFIALAFVPDPALVLILVGSFPWLARIVPTLRGLDVRRPATGAACGATVTAAQLLAGASGPLLDAFYLRTEVDRRSIVATKALTQAAGHVVKIGYYAWVSNAVLDEVAIADIPIWLVGAGIVLAVPGARIGTRLLERFDDRQFRRVTGWVILGLGALCIVKGARDLLVA
ncbi:MAG: sulfite exporter TauE/SafE family protein [Gammaproteobacteria bacterium]|nr:sulfite exporter TauE/SafE family protein [Gammaproteobacteria bacterium]